MNLLQLHTLLDDIKATGAHPDTPIRFYLNREAERCQHSPERPPFLMLDIETQTEHHSVHRVYGGLHRGEYHLPLGVAVDVHPGSCDWVNSGD